MSGKSEVVQFRADKGLMSQLLAVAQQQDLSVSALVRTWVVQRLRSELLQDKQDWQQSRFEAIAASLSKQFLPGPLLIIHAFPPPLAQEIPTHKFASRGSVLPMLRRLPIESRINRLGYESVRRQGELLDGYCQLFRNGRVELVSAIGHHATVIWGNSLEMDILLSVSSVVSYLSGMQFPLPYSILISVMQAKDYWLEAISNDSKVSFLFPHVAIQEDLFTVKEILIEAYGQASELKELAAVLYDAITEIWNASGVAASPSYDNDGEWHRTFSFY